MQGTTQGAILYPNITPSPANERGCVAKDADRIFAEVLKSPAQIWGVGIANDFVVRISRQI
jgi:hypothetical protein